jgi:hypothetical protein
LSEINKYSLKQLREALHAIETDEKKKNAAPKLESKKRPRHYGGTLNESSAAGLVRMFQEAKFERMIKSNLLTKQQL